MPDRLMLHDLKPAPGSRKNRIRVGRGGSGRRGRKAGRGTKGLNARNKLRPGFEGGQLPFVKRMPHQRGFRNPFRVEYQVVNVADLERFDDGAVVTPEALIARGLVRNLKTPVKILGTGELTKALEVSANKFSDSAKQKIEAAKGKVEVIGAATAGPAE